MPKNKQTTLSELYKLYSYPCWDISLLEKNIVPVPYIPKDKINCNHKYSLEYNKWKEIVLCIFEHMCLYLLNGYELRLPHKLGILQLKKRRATSIDKIHLQKTGEVKRIRHIETNGYKPILKWSRFGKSAYFANKGIWKINFLKTRWRSIIKEIQKDFSKINKLVDA